MTNEQILEKAVKKAIKNGWCDEYDYYEGDIETPQTWTRRFKDRNLNEYYYSEYEVIFSHDFAKCFWGTADPYTGLEGSITGWKWHLQQMVLEENPISYLEKFI